MEENPVSVATCQVTDDGGTVLEIVATRVGFSAPIRARSTGETGTASMVSVTAVAVAVKPGNTAVPPAPSMNGMFAP
jgi:hypothetical protein